MNILLCHNHYQHPGGEDQTFADEARLLESRGHGVIRFTLHNDEIEAMSRWQVARKTLWNGDSYRRLRNLIQRERPQLMHCTNTFPLISPAAYYAARDEGVPVVQSLHNYRMFCANSLFLRDGRICQDCLGKRFAWPAVAHGCYRGSRVATACVAAMNSVHQVLKTWMHTVRLYCTPTEFARGKFIEGGLPADKIVVKPNFVYEDLGVGRGRGGYVVFVGRLSQEKGIEVLLKTWNQWERAPQLKIVGDGPLADRVSEAAKGNGSIEWLGRKSARQVGDIIGRAACIVLPSICYETFGRSVIEAYCKGTPVIASDQGAMTELVRDQRTGFLVPLGSAEQLRAKLEQLLNDPRLQQRLRRAARQEYERAYTARRNYELLMQIYARACGEDARAGQPVRRGTDSFRAVNSGQ